MEKKFNLQKYREKYGITQQQLAELIGVNFRYISMIETGAKPLTQKFVKKLELLDAGRGHQNTTSTDPPFIERHVCMADEKAGYPSECLECKKKQAHIDRLERIIDKLTK